MPPYGYSRLKVFDFKTDWVNLILRIPNSDPVYLAMYLSFETNKSFLVGGWKVTLVSVPSLTISFWQANVDQPVSSYLGLDTMTILTIRYKTVIINHDELRHRNKGRITNQDGLRHGDFELL